MLRAAREPTQPTRGDGASESEQLVYGVAAGAQCGAAHGAHARTWAAIESAAVELRDQTRVAGEGPAKHAVGPTSEQRQRGAYLDRS